MSSVTLQKWGGLASWMLAMAYAVPSVIYLVGDLRSALGPLTYDLADFLYGPVWAVSLISSFLALRARIGSGASGRMSLAWTAAWVAAAAMICVAFIRSANRHYHLMHPELHLESSETVLTVWATLVAGVIGVGGVSVRLLLDGDDLAGPGEDRQHQGEVGLNGRERAV